MKFLNYRDYLVIGTPEAIAIADVNNDGIPDAVAATGNGTQILLGGGDGGFASPILISSVFSTALAVADFNNDGKPDIAISVVTNGSSLVLALGNGDGTFQKPIVLPISCLDCSLAVADFNGDGNMDLAVASTSSVTVALGNGDGTFSVGQPAYTTQDALAVIAGDANKDGKPDLVVTDFQANTVTVLLGNGDGSFRRTDYPVGPAPFQTVLADFNGDGLPDLAVSVRDALTVGVMLNQGGGAFGLSVSYPAGCSPSNSCTLEGLAGDFNRDGKMDLATPGAFLLGNGDGTFQTPEHFHSGAFPSLVASGDLNGDGFSDLLTANGGATNISVLLGNPQPWRQLEISAGNQPKDVAVADFNGDGKMDLAVAASGDNQVHILLGNGNGLFSKGVSLSAALAGAVMASDLNGDGKVDLAISGDKGTFIYLGNGDGTFASAAQYPSFFGDCTAQALQQTAAPCLAVADFNGDGVPDLVGALWINDTVSFMLGNGDGTFHPGPQTLTMADTPQGIAIGDFNHDGKMDVAVGGLFGSVTVFPGKGDGTFGAAIVITRGGLFTGAGVAVGDLNGDGHPDIVLAGGSGSSTISLSAWLITGNGDLTFNTPVPLPADQAPNVIALADFNGDGRLDIASVNLLGQDVSVLINRGGRMSTPDTLYGVGLAPVVVRAADLNGDGRLDLVVVNQNSNDLSILLQSPR